MDYYFQANAKERNTQKEFLLKKFKDVSKEEIQAIKNEINKEKSPSSNLQLAFLDELKN